MNFEVGFDLRTVTVGEIKCLHKYDRKSEAEPISISEIQEGVDISELFESSLTMVGQDEMED